MSSMFSGNMEILTTALDASYLRNEMIAHNIANVDTPNYKRKDVTFESYLQKELNFSNEVNLNNIQPTVYTDKTDLEYRIDGNNVDIELEMVKLTENQLKYNTLIDQVRNDFNRMKTVLN